jgi:hypothetical protein
MMSTGTIREDKIRDIARRNGEAAASWVFDGNTDEATYARVARMLDDGDPELYGTYRTPSLSGEFAGDYNETDLCDELGISDQDTVARDAAASIYMDEVDSAFWREVERLAREHLGEDA